MSKQLKKRKFTTDAMRIDILTSKLTVSQLAEKHVLSINAVYTILRNRNVK